MPRLPLVHAFGSAFIDDALGVAEGEILGTEADGAQKLEAGNAGRAGAVANELGCRDFAAGQLQRVDQPGGGDDRRAVLVVMENGNIEKLAQPLLDDEALRRLDVLEIDAAPALAEQPDAIDEFVRILGRDFEVDRIDVGEALEQHRLAFHHRLRRERAAIAEPENGGAIGDDCDEIALRRVVVGARLVFGDRQHRNGDAGRIGERQIALRRHRLGRHDFELSRPALAVKQQGFLVGKGRPLRAVAVFRSHFNSLLTTCGGADDPPADVSGTDGLCSRDRPPFGRAKRLARSYTNAS